MHVLQTPALAHTASCFKLLEPLLIDSIIPAKWKPANVGVAMSYAVMQRYLLSINAVNVVCVP